MSEDYTFENKLLSISINGYGLYRYNHKTTDKVKIELEQYGRRCKSVIFDNFDEYEQWFDRHDTGTLYNSDDIGHLVALIESISSVCVGD